MSRAIWIIAFALFTVASLGFWGVAVWQDRSHTIRDTESRAAILVRLLEEHAERALESGDAVVRSLAAQAADWDMQDAAAGERIHARMVEAVGASPPIGAVWLLDRDGQVRLDSWKWPSELGNFSHRRYFRLHRDGLDGLHVGPPDTGSVTGETRFTLSRPILDAAGAFRGVAVAGVYSDYFRRFYEEAPTPEGTHVRLVSLDGTVLAAWPPAAADLPPPDFRLAVAAAATGPAAIQRGDGRIWASLRLPDATAIVTVSLPLGPALAGWRQRTELSAIAPVAAVLGFALLMAAGLRGVARLRHANRDLEARVAERTAALARSETVARERYEELEALYGDAPAGLALFDRDLRFRRVNATLAALHGMTPAEHLGRALEQVVPKLAPQIAPHLHAVFARGLPVLNAELRGETPDRPGEERVWRASFYPVTEADGRVAAAGAVVHEMTAAVRAQEAALESERELQLVADALPALIAFVDDRECYRFVNRAYAEWMGRVRSQIERHPLKEVMPPESYRKVAPNIRAVLGGTHVRQEVAMADASGRERHLDAQYIPRVETGGRISGFYLFAADIGDRKEAEQRQSLLMAELDHRVRNILASIRSMVSLTEASTDSKEAFGTALRGRVEAMARTHGLVTQHKWRGAEVAEIVADELAAYAPDESAWSLHEGAPCLLPPKQALNMALVVHELATNAAKYGALSVAGGHVAVSWRLQADRAGRVLHFLWRESGGPAIERPGRPGFGSQLIRSALGNDGETRVDLSFPAEGARCEIRLYLPEAPAEAPRERVPRPDPAAAPAAAGDEGGGLQGLRILVVEDETLLAMDLERQLMLLGATVVGPADSLQAGEALIARGGFDLALLDLNLQGLSSEPLADMLLQRGLPFLFLTGYQAAQLLPPRLRGVPALQKPADPEALLQHLRRLAGAPPPPADRAAD